MLKKTFNFLSFFIIIAFTFIYSCKPLVSEYISTIDVNEFEKKLDEFPYAILLDVRTAAEYDKGCITGAYNLDWDGKDFKEEVKSFDKSEPIFVYCKSGGRSEEAAEYLSKNGFKKVYNLKGGMRAWENSGKDIEPVYKEEQDGQNAEEPMDDGYKDGMSLDDYKKMTTSDKLVLVDFSAEWCGPCKKMEPILKQIGEEMKSKVQIVTIDVDENEQISTEMNIQSIPAMILYKNGVKVWNTIGQTSKETIIKQINTFM